MFESIEASLSERFPHLFATLDVGASSFADIFSQNFSDASLSQASLTILFNSKLAAKEAGYMLRSPWDGCNTITITRPDFTLLRTVLALVKSELGCDEAEYCCSEDFCDTLAYSENGIVSRLLTIDILPEQRVSLFGDRTFMSEGSYFDPSQQDCNILEIPDLYKK